MKICSIKIYETLVCLDSLGSKRSGINLLWITH